MSKRVVLKKGNKMFIGISTSVYKMLGYKSPETIRRKIRGKKNFHRRGFDVFTDTIILINENTFHKQFAKCMEEDVITVKDNNHYCNRFNKQCMSSTCKHLRQDTEILKKEDK